MAANNCASQVEEFDATVGSILKSLVPSLAIKERKMLDLYPKERAYLRSMIESVVYSTGSMKNRRSDSTIVIGPPGCGKTFLIEEIMYNFEKSKPHFHDKCIVIRMNGMFCKDYRHSLRELKDQLMECCEKENINNEVFNDFESMMKNDDLEGIMDHLKEKLTSFDKAVIFILDSMDSFVSHEKQTFLYNLLDLTANNTTVPVLVLGVTCHYDIFSHFEKRVLSRLSQRKIYLDPNSSGYAAYEASCNHLLLKDGDEEWNAAVNKAMNNACVKNMLKHIHETNGNIRQLVMYLYLVAVETSKSGKLDVNAFIKTFEHIFKVSAYTLMVKDFKLYEVAALAAIYKHMSETHRKIWRPNTLYESVKQFLSARGINKTDFFQGLSLLEGLRYVMPLNTLEGSGCRFRSDQYFRCDLPIYILKDIVQAYPSLPVELRKLFT